jgi:hypothetical protein
MVPLEFRNSYLNNTLGTFDVIVTYSSVEHSGLGRFGDMLNPWGNYNSTSLMCSKRWRFFDNRRPIF